MWGIYCVVTASWVYDSDPDRPVSFALRREAAADLDDWCIKQFRKDYEVRRYDGN